MVHIDKSCCDDCGTCVSVCSDGALKITTELEINKEKCIHCFRCIQVCPVAALSTSED